MYCNLYLVFSNLHGCLFCQCSPMQSKPTRSMAILIMVIFSCVPFTNHKLLLQLSIMNEPSQL